jgi:hypothetical protein
MGSVGTGRQLYEQLVADRPRDHRGWLQYAQLERIFGTVDSTQGVQLFKKITYLHPTSLNITLVFASYLVYIPNECSLTVCIL